jgi:hypothetical protein
MTTVGRKPIVCWPEIDAEGGIESTSRVDARKDWQRTMGGKAGAEEIGSALRIEGVSLSKTLRATHTECQTTSKPNKQNRKKTTVG